MADEVNFVHDGVEQRKAEEEELQRRRREWFATLPANELSNSEDMLRKALVKYLEACPSPQSMLKDVCRCQEVRFRKLQCLPRFITISQWIKSRGHGIQINEAQSTIWLSANWDRVFVNLPPPKKMRVTLKPASKPMPKPQPKPRNVAPPFHLRFGCFEGKKINIWTAAQCDLNSLAIPDATRLDVRMWSDPDASYELRQHDGGHPEIIRRLLQREPHGDKPTFADWLKQRLEEWKTQVVKDQALNIVLY